MQVQGPVTSLSDSHAPLVTAAMDSRVCYTFIFEKKNANFNPKTDERKRCNFYSVQVEIPECDTETETTSLLSISSFLLSVVGMRQLELVKQRKQLSWSIGNNPGLRGPQSPALTPSANLVRGPSPTLNLLT